MKLTKVKIILISIFALGLVNIPYLSSAQTEIEVQESEINIEVNPSNPEPYQNVNITLTSYATDLNKAIITWQSGQDTVLSGIGKTTYIFKLKGADMQTVLNINIRPVGSVNTVTKKISVTPHDLDIMWESVDGYTPPFYKGKSLPINGGFIKAVAIPSTNTIKSGNGSMTYTWKNNGSVVQDSSGYNKNSYIFKNSMFDNKNEVTVIASSVGGNYSAEKKIEIPTYKPKIIFYKKSLAEGVLYNNALDTNSSVSDDELTLVGEPYFLPIKTSGVNFTYNWKINGEPISTPSKKTELTVRPTSRGGYATIALSIENLSELFQKVTNQIKLNL